MIKLFCLHIALFLSVLANGQIIINEVMAANAVDTTDEDGDDPDWIELYNAGASPVDLQNYGLSDDVTDLNKWKFNSSYVLQPGGHILVFASGKDISVLPAVPPTISNDMTTDGYDFADNAHVPAGNSFISYPEFPGTAFGTDMGNPVMSATINYLDNAVIGFSYAGVYQKLGGWATVLDRSAYKYMRLYMDLGLGETVSIQFSQVGLADWLNYTVPLTGTGVPQWYEIPLFETPGYDPGQLDLTQLQGFQIIGISPFGAKTFRLTGVEFTHPGFSFHTNFSVSASGEIIYLLDDNNIVIDNVAVPELESDISYGRKTDGASTWVYFSDATAGRTNNGAPCFTTFSDTVAASPPAGFYPTSLAVTLTSTKPIYYTLDGSDPDSTSTLYVGPINIDSTTVIRAIGFNSGDHIHDISTNSYIINESTDLRTFSLSLNPWDMFSDSVGIYAMGPNADTVNFPHFGANFWEDWERKVHVEYFDSTGSRKLSEDCGIEIFGNWSKGLDQKSFKLKAKEQYGPTTFDYKFFDKDKQSQFQHLVLRNSGSDFGLTQFHDALIGEAIEDIAVADKQDYEPSIVFVNGEYWGIMNLRHHLSLHYIEEKYHLDGDSFNLETAWGTPLHGNATFNDDASNILVTNMAIQSNYDQYIQLFDFDSYIDHFVTQMYVANWDWPQNNLKIWKKVNNGQYRYMTYDLDLTLGLYGLLPTDSNTIDRFNYTSDNNSRVFNQFLQNTEFRNYFINRSADFMNTVFRSDLFNQRVDQMRAVLLSEMPKHISRWGLGNMSNWDNNIDDMRDFINDRPAIHRDDILQSFGLTDTFTISIDVNPVGAGYIEISTIAPNTHPWSGIYFQGVPVAMKAVANPGFTFDNWTTVGYTVPSPTQDSFAVTGGTICSFTAHFSGSPVMPSISISEIMYNDPLFPGKGDWIELHNNGTVYFNLTDWYLEDQNSFYQFPDNTILQPGERIVVSRDLNTFQAKYPGTTNVIGNFPFNLSNGGETIRLTSPQDTTYQLITYDDNNPWPTDADGNGYTLELGNYSDVNNGNSWFTGCLWGSPGYAYNVSCVNGVDEEGPMVLTIFPNPNDGTFSMISEDQNFTAGYVTDGLGRQYQPDEVSFSSQSASFKFSNLTPGLYILHLENKGGIIVTTRLLIN